MPRPPIAVVLSAAAVLACGDRTEAQSESAVRAMAAELQAGVQRGTGLPFKRPPVIAVRSREEVRDYLARKLDQEYGENDFARVELAYKLFGLLPDTLDLRALLLSLYTEQIVGYYDPDSTALYLVHGALPEHIRLTLMHELVHALQDQYVPLDSLLTIERNNDRRMAAQAVMEGQATLVTVRLMLPEQDVGQLPQLWNEYRQAVRRQHQQMPVFAAAPLVVREGLIFPYLAGADFVRWFSDRFRDTVPFGPRLPESTEQILHPDRYLVGDRPVELRYPALGELVYEDNLGAFETRTWLTELTGSEAIAGAGAQGWAGDRYAVLAAGGGRHALVWWTLWDDAQAQRRFASIVERYGKARPGRARRFERVALEGYPAVLMIDAPTGWDHEGVRPSVVRVR